MSSTKIINVLKDDSFQEILDIFKATPAGEVIFVLPKRSKAFQKDIHFAELKTEAKKLNKAVSFLCSNPDLNDIAKKYHFDVLLARSPAPRKKSNSINVVNQIEDFYTEPAKPTKSLEEELEELEEDDLDEEESAPVITTAAASRKLDDIRVPDNDHHNIRVSGPKEKAMPVEVHQAEFINESLENRALDEIRGVWNQPAAPAPVIKVNKPALTSWLKGKKFPSSGRPRHRTGMIALACLSLVILGSVIFISTGEAKVTIKPTDKPLDISINVFASDSISAVSLDKMSIPGQVFNIQKTVKQDFQATGFVDVAQKARGSIKVYNELSATQPLVATTRFESSDGHVFRTLTSIVVPAAKTVGGKLVPGTIDVQVIADKAGADYNVPAGKFTIPAFKEKGDTTKHQKIYGQSSAQMHSGTSGKTAVVTEENMNTAKEALTTALLDSIKDELSSQVKDLKILNSNDISVGQPTSNNPVDSTTKTFTASLEGSIKTVGFKQSHLDSLITQYVEVRDGTTIVPEKMNLVYDSIKWDEEKGGLTFSVRITGPSYAKIDIQRIANELLGKNDGQIKAYLGGVAGISEANVALSPFWVRSIPRDKDRVHVDLSY